MKRIISLLSAKSLQSCPTLCDPTDGSPPGSPIPGILQARTLEWVAISFSNAWKWEVKVKSLSRVWPLATPWTGAYQAPTSMGFSRQEYWSGLPLPSPQCFPTDIIIVKIKIFKMWAKLQGLSCPFFYQLRVWATSCCPLPGEGRNNRETEVPVSHQHWTWCFLKGNWGDNNTVLCTESLRQRHKTSFRFYKAVWLLHKP